MLSPVLILSVSIPVLQFLVYLFKYFKNLCLDNSLSACGFCKCAAAYLADNNTAGTAKDHLLVLAIIALDFAIIALDFEESAFWFL
jgi:phosphoglucomutase